FLFSFFFFSASRLRSISRRKPRRRRSSPGFFTAGVGGASAFFLGALGPAAPHLFPLSVSALRSWRVSGLASLLPSSLRPRSRRPGRPKARDCPPFGMARRRSTAGLPLAFPLPWHD